MFVLFTGSSAITVSIALATLKVIADTVNFKLASKRWNIEQLAGWTCRHMRKFSGSVWHNKKGRLNALRRLGAKPHYLKVASSSRGAWLIERSPVLHTVLSNATL